MISPFFSRKRRRAASHYIKKKNKGLEQTKYKGLLTKAGGRKQRNLKGLHLGYKTIEDLYHIT
jgi:hypothetical protein